MASWTGTYTPNTNTGTTTSLAATTLTCSTATWTGKYTSPAGRWRIRITSGAATGSYGIIDNIPNATTVGFTAGWVGTTPTGTPTFEIVSRFEDQDHIIANTTFAAGSIVECADSATVYADGLYTLSIDGTATVIRFGKTESTLITFCANNRTTAGKQGFWNGIYPGNNAALTVAPDIYFLKVQDSLHCVYVDATNLGTLSTIHHIWSENTTDGRAVYSWSGLKANCTISNVFIRHCGDQTLFNATGAFTQRADFWWFEYGGKSAPWIAPPGTLEWASNCVFLDNQAASAVGFVIAASREVRMTDCYATASGANGFIGVVAGSGASSILSVKANMLSGQLIVYGTGTTNTTALVSYSNDYVGLSDGGWGAGIPLSPAGTTAYLTSASDQDYMAGNNGAALENADTTNGVSSTGTPVQFANLHTTGRTTARSTRNFPLTIDNVVVGTPTSSSCAFTFDSASGAAASQKTTSTGTNSSGQAVVTVTATTMFYVGAAVEVVSGSTVNTGTISSISAGTSITLDVNLANTFSAGSTVSLALRHKALPFIRYGTASGVYTMSTPMPDRADFGLFWSGLRTALNGYTTSFKRTGHAITLQNLKGGTTYYAKCYAETPLGEVLAASAESSFTTSAVGAGQTVAFGFAG